jgi:hypothetical protein
MAITISPEDLFFGTPTSVTYGGTECGATVDPPVVTITPTLYKPDFQNAVGPVTGAVFITGVEAKVEMTVNEITAAKLAWALPGATEALGVISWSPGRVGSSAFKDLILVGAGLDGRTLTFTLLNALPEGALSIPFSKSEISGMKLSFIGYVDTATPNTAPFTIEIAGGS